jgi:hypothetical protein
VGGLKVGLQTTPFIAEFDPVANTLSGQAIWTGEPITLDTYDQGYPIYEAVTVKIPGGLTLDPTKVYGAFLTALEPNYAAWPDDGPNNSGIMEVVPNLYKTVPEGRGSLGSTARTLVAMQAGTWTALNYKNGLAFHMTFVALSDLTVTTKKEVVNTVAGRVVKIRYTITNPSDAYIADQEFQVRSTGCDRTWLLPVSLAAGKKTVITIAYKADKCSTSTGTILTSSILGTAVTGPDVEVNIKPAAFLPKYCDGYVGGRHNKTKYM